MDRQKILQDIRQWRGVIQKRNSRTNTESRVENSNSSGIEVSTCRNGRKASLSPKRKAEERWVSRRADEGNDEGISQPSQGGKVGLACSLSSKRQAADDTSRADKRPTHGISISLRQR